MEEIRPARRSSGVYYANAGNPSQQSFGSAASLRAHAAAPAGGPSAVPGAIPSSALSGWDDRSAPAAAVAPAVPHRPFYKKRWFIISQIILIPLSIALLFILLFPVVRAIVALVVKRTNLDIEVAAITQPVNGSFGLHLQGNVFNTGIIPASIKFTEDANVTWIEDDGTETPVGAMQLQNLSAKHKRAVIDMNTTFHIVDEDAFGRFSAHLITAQNFTWRLVSRNLKVQAVKFPVANGITFDKTITLNGFNSFKGGVTLLDLQLPSDDPAGGIKFVAKTLINNPSPFSLDLGTVVFALSYQNVPLGIGTGTNTVITPNNNTITLAGTLVPQTGVDNLGNVSQLFTNYLNSVSSPVIAKGLSTLQSDGSTISWLSTGLESLALTVPFKPLTPINPIQSITIGDFGLDFDSTEPYTPLANTKTVQASLQLPFGFSLSIGEIQNDFTIVALDGSPVAGLTTGLGASTSSISVLSPNDTRGTINITIADTRLTCPDNQHATFSAFNANLTNSDVTDFRLVGHSRAIANMSIGQITLDAIAVNVSTSLNGLRGLKNSTTIDSVDVVGGTSSAINLDFQVTISNPSSLELSTGDLNLQLLRDNVLLGTALLPNLTLIRGNNTVNATSNFDANASPQGLQTLNDFVNHTDVVLTIAGFNESTNIASLLAAFETLSINAVLPALKTNLLNTAALTILPTTGTANNITHVTVALSNPFTAPLTVTKISSSVSTFGIPLGTINQDVNFTSAPKGVTQSPQLDLDLNFDPASLFTVTRALASEAGLDPAPLDQIVSIAGLQYLPINQEGPALRKRHVEGRANIFTGFDLPTFVQTAFKKLMSDVSLSTGLKIGDYATTLEFNQSSVPTATDKTLDFILPVLASPIVQKVVGGAALGLDSVLIINPEQNSFRAALKGSVTNAGPFDAIISFPAGLTISWQGKPIGQVSMSDIKVTGDVGGTIDSEAIFQVADLAHLTDFTKTLLTTESFDWEISGENLTVNALGISVPGISFTPRIVTLKGFNGLVNGVTINSFDLPSNDPAGGIHLTINSTVVNPSQVGIQLSSLGFNTFVGDVMIGPVTSSSSVNLMPGSTSELHLQGRLVPQGSVAGLQTVSTVFNNFIQGEDSNVIVQGVSAGSGDVTWLNDGIKALQIATVLPNQGKLNIIKSIDLNELTLMFSNESPFAPLTSTKSTDAAFSIPFAFPLDITALQQTINLGFSGSTFGQLVIPKGPSKTDIGARIIHLTFANIPLEVSDGGQSTFDRFVAATTVGSKETLQLIGSADADADTAVGLLSLKNITFSVNSDIAGLQGLNTRPVTINSLDVNHGFSDFLLIKVNSALFNPSNLTIGTGDVSFTLEFQGQDIGSADISNLVILPGNTTYPIDVHFAPQGGAVSAGNSLLEDFIQGQDTDTTISGTTESTSIQSLQSALAQIHLSPVTIPGLKDNLIKGASLSFPTDIVNTGVASTSFTLANPFTASINLLQLAAKATFHDLTLGNIPHIDTSTNPITALGHGSVTSPTLPLDFNLDPTTIIQLLLLTSSENNVDLGPLTQLFQFILSNPGFKPPVKTSVDLQPPTCVSGNQFDIDGAILKSLAGLKVDLSIESSFKLDDFAADLTFAQKSVPALVDKTVLFLVGAVAGPVAQHLVDGSILSFSEADLTNLSNEGFDLSLKGSLTNIGPLDALITFIDPLNVNWQGKDIATISLPPICAAANDGVPNYEAKAALKISDSAAFTEFAIFLLHNPSFDWTISTSKLRIEALGTIFDDVLLSKVITLKAFNGLPGVTISNFQLPSDDPAGGIHIETDASIPSPAQLGIDLGIVTFQTSFQGTVIGPLSASGLSLKANSLTKTHLSGRIVPKSGADLDKTGSLFSHFLNGQNTTLQTTGQSVQPPGSSGAVDWLSTAFKSLTLDVILPGEKFQVIKEIDLNDLDVTIKTNDESFDPPTTSHNTVAKYANPFGFSLQVVEVGQTIDLGNQGKQIAQLIIPSAPATGGVSTGNVVDLDIVFTDIPLKALDQTAFVQLFAGVTLLPDVEIDLTGNANVVARTSIGDVPIVSIPFNVKSQLKGINSFGGTASLSNVSVVGSGGGGGSEFIVAPLTTTLQNPSNVSLETINVALPVIFNGVMIGRAAIDEFDLKPGVNIISTEFHYEPADANDTVAQGFLTQFIQTGDALDLSIHGDSDSTPFASLQGALSGLKLSASLTGLDQPTFITHIHVTITLDSLVTNLVSVDFDVQNPLDADLVLEFVQSDAGVNGETFAQFSQGFDSFVVPPGQTVNSGVFGNVLLTQGAIASLDIIPLGFLDVQAAATVRVGQGGYQIPFLKLQQQGVPTTYDLSLDSLSAMKKVASSAAASSLSISETAPASSALSPTATEAHVSATGEPTTTKLSTPEVPTVTPKLASTLTSSTIFIATSTAGEALKPNHLQGNSTST
ncbi:hypothetical protein BDN70DRAFT_872495 [Pholiota conissans]|uniref:Uncharacterized protein n=1 Tax=Pholiota conissans TaxID=109636 RepID=A0A9P5ZB80_9AGAR|nr:hypothetical protein BDN70DRAFT_872495 [Pholiota conissans]